MKILLLETIADEALQILEEADNIEIFAGYDPNTLTEIVSQHNIDAIITRGIGKINADLIDACPNLQVVARCGVGLDNVDVNYATVKKIKVVNAPGSNAATVAEHTIALALMLQRNLYQAISDVKNGNWAARNTFKSDEVGGKTIGILGLGNIGLRVARITEALGMKVIYWSKTNKNNNYKYVTKEELLSMADIVSIHLPLHSETENLINTTTLQRMKPTAILINTARAQIVNKADILHALNAGLLAGYGADVPTSPIPEPTDALINHPKALITAHISSLTSTTYVNMCIQTVNNVLAILNGKTPQLDCIFNRHHLA
jgi:D-3-phosphoglycerate dehydrogenase / 2-oxoglutarate reductase